RFASLMDEPGRASLWWWLAPLGAVTIAATLGLLMILRAGPPAAPLPRPPAALLEKQARALAAHDLAALDAAMQGYRRQIYAALGHGWAAAHGRADQALAHGELDAARAALASILPLQGNLSELDRRVVLQDTHFRLARIALAAGRAADAAAQADAGLALGQHR